MSDRIVQIEVTEAIVTNMDREPTAMVHFAIRRLTDEQSVHVIKQPVSFRYQSVVDITDEAVVSLFESLKSVTDQLEDWLHP